MTPEQLPLPVTPPRRRAYGREDFVVTAANAAALALIEGWRGWPGGQAALSGPEGAGKTHLAHVWMEMAGAELISAAQLRAEDAPGLVAAGAVVVEDADRMGAAAETALFHLMNLARAEGAPLLLTGHAAPARWGVRLPDLGSRLEALPHVALEAPDDALMRGLIARHFEDRHLRVGDDVIDFLVLRLDRSAAAARDMVERLDRAALTAGRRITVRFVKDVTGL